MIQWLKSVSTLRVAKCFLVLLLLQLSAHSETPKTPDPVVGKWRWTDQQIVECLADGSFNVSPTNRKGKWRAVENKGESLKYEFTWDEGLFVDALLMSRDHKQLTGKNKDKKKITASKVD